jgi:hypothetical protein
MSNPIDILLDDPSGVSDVMIPAQAVHGLLCQIASEMRASNRELRKMSRLFENKANVGEALSQELLEAMKELIEVVREERNGGSKAEVS